MLRILSIYDWRDLLDICKQYLEETGEFTVDTTTSAALAVEMLKKPRMISYSATTRCRAWTALLS